jgi:hypothetical protein
MNDIATQEVIPPLWAPATSFHQWWYTFKCNDYYNNNALDIGAAFKREQIHFQEVVKLLFPQVDIWSDAKKTVELSNVAGLYLEVDVWIPDIKLGFEYQVRKLKERKKPSMITCCDEDANSYFI